MPRPLRKVFDGQDTKKLDTRVRVDTREALTELHEVFEVPVALIVDTALREFMVAFMERHQRAGSRVFLANTDPRRRAQQKNAIDAIFGRSEDDDE